MEHLLEDREIGAQRASVELRSWSSRPRPHCTGGSVGDYFGAGAQFVSWRSFPLISSAIPARPPQPSCIDPVTSRMRSSRGDKRASGPDAPGTFARLPAGLRARPSPRGGTRAASRGTVEPPAPACATSPSPRATSVGAAEASAGNRVHAACRPRRRSSSRPPTRPAGPDCAIDASCISTPGPLAT